MKETILQYIRNHKELAFFIAVVLVTYLFTYCSPDKHPQPTTPQESLEVATFIPDGFSLVPIEIANYQTLDSIFGSFGVVDLYVQDPLSPNYSRLVAKFVKVVRAPKNPSHFAALIPHTEINKLMRYAGPFFVVIQNSKSSGTHFENAPLQKQRISSRIQFNTGD
ncbi:MAG: hypothetical protein H6623_00160 [Bdellovibrionaceae bacterium]|nr:hypothetical protein [Pseudobdellovibrionaceae bacterium]